MRRATPCCPLLLSAPLLLALVACPVHAQIAGVPGPDDHFGQAVATGDFDGDGFTDLAVGVDGEVVDGQTDAGAVHVLYGTADGLAEARNAIWHENSPGVEGDAEPGDRFGYALAAGDFDGDGYDDLAVGAPYEERFGTAEAGVVHVLYGSAVGLTGSGSQSWVYNPSSNPGRFGFALAAGDFGTDSYADLAVGAPYGTVDDQTLAGFAVVLYGSADGLTEVGSQLWHQDVADVQGAAENGDFFGFSLAAGDFGGDGDDDLAIGIPSESFPDFVLHAGAVLVLYAGPGGLDAAGNDLWHQDVEGMLDENDIDQHFGRALAAGDFDADGRDDLAIGITVEEPGGAVQVLYGTISGLSATGNQLWTQDSPNVEGAAEGGDRFGHALAAGDFGGDGDDDLAIGVNGEDVGDRADAGAVNVLFGGSGGLSAQQDQIWYQDVSGILGVSEDDDAFGHALAAGDFDGDGRSDLAVGVVGETVGETPAAGAVQVLYAAEVGGLNADGNQLLYQGAVLAPTSDLVVVLTPEDPPVVVPSEGGSFTFTVAITNAGAGSQTFDVWAAVTGPVALTRGPRSLTLAAGATASRTLTQNVPAGAPAGVYTYTVNAGTYPSVVLASDAFGFTKEAPAHAARAAQGEVRWSSAAWDDAGWTITNGEAASAPASGASLTAGPDAFALYAASPNPFRASTTLRFDMPVAGPVRLVVYDLLGRTAAVLVDEARLAGTHEAVFEASRLSSGTYVVRLEAGSIVQTRRVTLLR